MLHIIGVAHRAQSRKPDAEETEAQQVFARLLKQIIQDVRPIFVAEEDSEEALANRREVSIAKELSDSARVEHRFCDPDRAQRKAIDYLTGEEILTRRRDLLGSNLRFEECSLRARAIEIEHYFPKRERFWLRGLNGCGEQNAVFICGDSHIESLTSLLKSEGSHYEIVARGIGMTEADHDYFRRIVEYLEAHPELRNG
jgi:hypothetical protein